MRAWCLAALLVILFFGPSQISGAQASNAPSASQSTTSNVPPGELYSKEPYVFELIETHVRFEADGTGQRDMTLRTRIQSESAVHEFGLLAYPYASSFESLDVIYVRVRKPDGTVLETPLSEIQELDTAVSRAAPMYTDEREKHIAVKSLAIGDTLEARLRWTIHEPMAPGHFWFDYSYFRSGICLQETLQVNVPRDVIVKLRNSEPQPSIHEENGRRLYTFKSSNLKKPEESKIPDWERNFHGVPPPDVQLSSFSSWDEVGKWFTSLAEPKVAVTPEIKAKAEELTKGKSSDDEKLHVLYDFVSSRFRYIGIDLGHGRYTPHAAADVLVNRYGDCKDKHTLFAALLQAVGITSYPVLISSKHRVDPSFPTLSLFDHVITAIPHGESYQFLDTTPEVAPFGLLAQNIRDRQALVIRTTLGANLVTTPADPPFPSVGRIHIESSIDANGTLDAKMGIEDRGDGELIFRLAYHSTPQNRWNELTQGIAQGLGFAGTVSDVTITQPEDTGKPFSVAFSYHRTDYPDWKDHRVIFPAPPIFLQYLNEEQKLSKVPLPLGALQDTTYDITIKFPEGYSVSLPEKVEQKSDFAEFAATYSLDHGVLHGILHLRTLLREVPGSERSLFSEFVHKTADTSRRYVFVSQSLPSRDPYATATATDLQKTETPVTSSRVPSSPVPSPAVPSSPAPSPAVPSSPVPSPPSPAANPTEPPVSPAKSLFDSARRAKDNRDYVTSAQLYEQAVASDPKYTEAWNVLGWTYLQLHQFQKSEAALRKALELDPQARFAHINLGWALEGLKKYEEAVAEYQKAIQIDAENGWLHASLGRTYVSLKQFEKAIPELETAATITPNDPAVQFNLGRAYAKTGQPEKAGQALKHSEELEPTAERKNWVAYEMALDKLQLDLAEKYAYSAIEHAVSQTKSVSLDSLSNEDIRVPSSLGAYWDTLGWVKFQQGNIPDAEKYVRCAWQVRSIGEIGDHLGQIYEKEGRKSEAIQLYAMALLFPQPMPETRGRLVALLGSDTDVDRLTKEARADFTRSRTIRVENSHAAEGTAEFWIQLVPGPKVSGVKFLAGDEALRPFSSDLQALTFPNAFPDAMEVRLLYKGRLTCLSSSHVCSFNFTQNGVQSPETTQSNAGPEDKLPRVVTLRERVSPLGTGEAGHVRMGASVVAAKLVKKVSPIYPPLARQTRIQGVVKLHAIIGEDGSVSQLELISGHPLLVQAALDAVKEWVYQPTLLEGKPVEVDTEIDVVFQLSEQKAQDQQE
jgi:TonB family protein